MQKQWRVARAAVFVFVALVCLWRLGAAPLLETDEGFAANRAASFQRHHTWRLSYDDVDDDKPQFRKPPLLYWAVASLYHVLGRNTWAVRLPGALASIALCWILYRINRRHFDELTALASVVLFASVPFVLVHMRTAMLDLPLLALTFAAIYALAYLPERRGSAALAGLAAAGAVLVKGEAGLLAIAVAVVHAFAMGGFNLRTAQRAATALGVTGLVFWIYAFKVVPHRWQEAMLTGMFIKEGTHRMLAKGFLERFHAVREPLWVTARFLIALAAPGLVALVMRARRPRPETTGACGGGAAPLRWALLMLLVCGPVIYIGEKQLVPYARYFLPVYPFLATLAALALSMLVRSRALAALTVLAVAALTFFLPEARGRNPSPHEMPVAGMQEIAERVPAVVPEGERILLLAGRTKCHQLLFYGQRPIGSLEKWLRYGLSPGAQRMAVVRKGYWTELPLVTREVIATAGEFDLCRITIAKDRPDVTGIILCKPDARARIQEDFARRGRALEPFAHGFLVLAP